MSFSVLPARTREERVAFALATWFGCGRSPIAPGTVGTLGALPLWFAVRHLFPGAVLVAAIVITFVGVWSAGVVARVDRAKDPQHVVIDEVAGVLLALALSPATTQGAFAAVVFFRVFDMVKPFPARRAERLPGGWGIVLDDIVAGLQAAGVAHLLGMLAVLG